MAFSSCRTSSTTPARTDSTSRLGERDRTGRADDPGTEPRDTPGRGDRVQRRLLGPRIPQCTPRRRRHVVRPGGARVRRAGQDAGRRGLPRPAHAHHRGLAETTVPEYADTHPGETFDLVFVDGGHSYEVASADIRNMAPAGRRGHRPGHRRPAAAQVVGRGRDRAWDEAIETGVVVLTTLCADGAEVDARRTRRLPRLGRRSLPLIIRAGSHHSGHRRLMHGQVDVCRETRTTWVRTVDGDRDLAYQGDPVTAERLSTPVTGQRRTGITCGT